MGDMDRGLGRWRRQRRGNAGSAGAARPAGILESVFADFAAERVVFGHAAPILAEPGPNRKREPLR